MQLKLTFNNNLKPPLYFNFDNGMLFQQEKASE